MSFPEDYQPIDCGLYDYLEIACMHGYEVMLSFRDGSTMRGDAHTTVTRDGGEYLVLRIGVDKKEIRLDKLRAMQVLSEPRSFEEISFEQPQS